MDGDLGADDDERIVELSSIAAIFPELVLDPANPFDAVLDLQVAPTAPVKVLFPPLSDGAPPAQVLPTPPDVEDAQDTGIIVQPAKLQTASSASDDIHSLAYLPPLTVRINLPEGYPAERPPKFEISTSIPWLPEPKISSLTKDGRRLWEELGHDQVVYTYIDHIQQAAENAFGLVSDTQDALSVPSDLKIALLDYDIKAKREKFENETFDCGICLEPKKGSACHRMLPCAHVFCVQCLQACYNNSIEEGDVDSVKCLEPACGREPRGFTNETERKKRRRKDPTLNPSELLQIPIEQEKVQRYVQLKRKKRLEADSSTVYCPRQWCQGAARSKKHPKPVDLMGGDHESEVESDDEPSVKLPTSKKEKEEEYPPMSERLCVCEDCGYAFCSVCKKGWHGELSACNPRKQAELNAEERASEDYLKLHTTKCPTCSSPSQKTMGCNHMICHLCKTHFCYLCSSWLDESNPYSHFNNHKSTCYMRLWELEAGDGDQIDHRFAGQNDNWIDEESDDDLVPFEPIANGNNIDNTDDDTDSEDDVWVPGPHFEQQNRNNNNNRRGQARGGPRRGRGNGRVLARNPVGHAPPPAPPPPHVREPAHPRLPAGFVREIPLRPAPAGGPPRAIPMPNIPAPALDHQAPMPQQAEQNLVVEVPAPANQPVGRVAAAPGQRRDAALQPAPVRAMGLERFLELARQNREEEWDSDELDEDFDDVGW